MANESDEWVYGEQESSNSSERMELHRQELLKYRGSWEGGRMDEQTLRNRCVDDRTFRMVTFKPTSKDDFDPLSSKKNFRLANAGCGKKVGSRLEVFNGFADHLSNRGKKKITRADLVKTPEGIFTKKELAAREKRKGNAVFLKDWQAKMKVARAKLNLGFGPIGGKTAQGENLYNEIKKTVIKRGNKLKAAVNPGTTAKPRKGAIRKKGAHASNNVSRLPMKLSDLKKNAMSKAGAGSGKRVDVSGNSGKSMKVSDLKKTVKGPAKSKTVAHRIGTKKAKA